MRAVRSKYDDQAVHYARHGSGLDAAVLTAVRGHVPTGARILVGGSGAGSECFALEEAGYEVVGVDFARRMVDAARAAAVLRGSAARFVQADLRHHEEPPSSLGAALFTYDVYGFVPGSTVRIEIIRRLRRALLPEGVLYLSARRITGAWARALLTLQWSLRLASGGGGEWGDSHTRWIDASGTIIFPVVSALHCQEALSQDCTRHHSSHQTPSFLRKRESRSDVDSGSRPE